MAQHDQDDGNDGGSLLERLEEAMEDLRQTRNKVLNEGAAEQLGYRRKGHLYVIRGGMAVVGCLIFVVGFSRRHPEVLALVTGGAAAGAIVALVLNGVLPGGRDTDVTFSQQPTGATQEPPATTTTLPPLPEPQRTPPPAVPAEPPTGGEQPGVGGLPGGTGGRVPADIRAIAPPLSVSGPGGGSQAAEGAEPGPGVPSPAPGGGAGGAPVPGQVPVPPAPPVPAPPGTGGPPAGAPGPDVPPSPPPSGDDGAGGGDGAPPPSGGDGCVLSAEVPLVGLAEVRLCVG